MVHHISEIFQSSERVHPGPLLSIHPSKHRTMSNHVTFHSGQIWYIQPNTTWACVPSFHGTRLKGPFVQISFLMPLSWVLLLTKAGSNVSLYTGVWPLLTGSRSTACSQWCGVARGLERYQLSGSICTTRTRAGPVNTAWSVSPSRYQPSLEPVVRCLESGHD
jgi:hypothetical protein